MDGHRAFRSGGHELFGGAASELVNNNAPIAQLAELARRPDESDERAGLAHYGPRDLLAREGAGDSNHGTARQSIS